MDTATFLQLEREINQYNEVLLSELRGKYGDKVVDEIEYELFADAGSKGKLKIVSEPKGERSESFSEEPLQITEVWADDESGTCEDGEGYDFSFYLKLDTGVYLKYHTIK
jgi:hypothetical protein